MFKICSVIKHGLQAEGGAQCPKISQGETQSTTIQLSVCTTR